MRKRVLQILGAALVLAVAYACGARLGLYGEHRGPGEVTTTPVPDEIIRQRERTQRRAARTRGVTGARQILFGDLHTHTTFSTDAFQASLPFLQGDGAHPPADACDFARYCSALDFWSINDHAEALTAQRWRETKQAIRQCNAVAGDPQNPDLVAFLGWEWTQVGPTPETHYGHRNVILRDQLEDRVPRRPISASGVFQRAVGAVAPDLRRRAPFFDFANRQAYYDLDRFARELEEADLCPEGVSVHDLPDDCLEQAATPADLFAKLDEWGFDSIVIPHGTSWGFYTPPGYSFDKQLSKGQHDPERQTLIEVYSGHGNSEEYRDWRAARAGSGDELICPEPRKDYVPACWRAGELIQGRCRAEGLPSEECERRAAEARRHALQAGIAHWRTVPGARTEDWLDSGQCRDCFQPAFNHRPGGSAQYMLALSRFEGPGPPQRFRFGFIASSDNHSARPGTGYKEVARTAMTDSRGARSPWWQSRLRAPTGAAAARSVSFDPLASDLPAFQLLDLERQASFFVTGGLVAVHAAGRSRDAIWESLRRREVYATSGERILLWFDLLNAPGTGGATRPMGSEVRMESPPVFRVRAIGAFRQNPGCPEHSSRALSATELQRLCRGECYHPSDERKRIERIEVIRILPQSRPDEPIADRIQDPWRSLPCPADPAGCSVEFEDPEFARLGRDAIYYIRAIQEATPAINAGNLRCERDAAGECVAVHPCWGGYRTAADDDCTQESEGRAWSSPIFVDFSRG